MLTGGYMSKDITTKPLTITLWLLPIVAAIELVVMFITRLMGGPNNPWVDAGLVSTIGAPFLYLWAVKVVGQRLSAEHLLRESEERYRRLVEFSPDAIYVHSDGKLVYVNDTGARLLGAERPEDLIGKPALDLVLPDYRDIVEERIRHVQEEGALEKDLVEIVCTKMIRLDGLKIDVEWSATHTIYGGQPAVQTIIRDITERKRLESQLVYLADHDHLTGLYNRRRFQQDLYRQINYALRYGLGGAVLFLDVDNFKYVNDTLGHRWGDELLSTLAEQLRERLRQTDILARLGGDEFAILVPQCDATQAQELAEEILHAVGHNDVVIQGQAIRITTSVGIALFPEHGKTAEELLTNADLSMYQAKEDGRNRICIYNPDEVQHAKMQLNLMWITRIREALERDRFVLHLQPILDLHQNRISQYEVLLRMVGDAGELIMPSMFLNVAERFGLIRDIDRWVVRRAIHLLAEFQKAGQDLCLEVNLSGKAFTDSELFPMIRRELEANAVNPANLVFEITETVACDNMAEAQHFIVALKALGCRFGLDDFGVGFSSFNYLKHLPVDYLKIDGGFIRDLPHDPVDQHLVKAMVEVARGLGKQTIAEFVENEETVLLLREYGVDYSQGYHIGRPGAICEVTPGNRDEADHKPPHTSPA